MNKTLEIAVKALDSKKAVEISALEVGSLTIVADYFVIAAGTSNTQVRALADEVEYQLGLQGIEPRQIEGKATGWILLDYYDVVIHVFLQDQREYYNLEKLWADSTPLDISSLVTEE
ncbi:MAG: ribosome silencing factor [Clostridia bacterium]|nr:ribosome silencing factor [Clostridia bacterium]